MTKRFWVGITTLAIAVAVVGYYQFGGCRRGSAGAQQRRGDARSGRVHDRGDWEA